MRTHPGDNGTTVGLRGLTLPKSGAVIHFEGTADELNAHLGLVKAMSGCDGTRLFIEKIQRNIIRLAAHVLDRSDARYLFSANDVAELENAAGQLSANTPPQTGFVLPGRDATEAQIHIARAVARRAERYFFAVNETSPLCPNAGAYLNRLSDYLFALSLYYIH